MDRCCTITLYVFLSSLCNVSRLNIEPSVPLLVEMLKFVGKRADAFASMYFHQTELSQMTAAWLLPIVAPIVASASGGIVADVLPNPDCRLWTVIVSYFLWGTGVPLAMVVLVIYFQRLAVYKLPPQEVIVSVFLPLGPLGQGGFAIMQLGKVAMEVFPKTGTLSGTDTRPGDILYVVGWLVALIMWGFAIVWLFFALASITRSKFPFNMGTSLRMLCVLPRRN